MGKTKGIKTVEVMVVRKGEKVALTNDTSSGTFRTAVPADGFVVLNGKEALFVSVMQMQEAEVEACAREAARNGTSVVIREQETGEEYMMIHRPGEYACSCGKRFSVDEYRRFERRFTKHRHDKAMKWTFDRSGNPVPNTWPVAWHGGRCDECGHVLTVIR